MAGRLAAVTGATGFLGRSLVTALSSVGWQVRVLARQSSAAAQFDDTTEIVIGDLSDSAALRKLVDGAAVVVHAAGLIKAPNSAAFRAVNVGGTENLVRAVNDCTAPKHLLLVSSMAAREPGLSDYAASKRAGEDAMIAGIAGGRHYWTIVRPCAVYGPPDKETLAIFRAGSRRVMPSPGARDRRLTLIHAADAADAIAGLSDAAATGRIFELTDRRVEGYAWPEIVAAVEAAMETRIFTLPVPGIAVRAAAVMNMGVAKITGRTPIFTLGKAREILHADWGSYADRLPPPDIWQSKIALEEGFRGTVSWYRDHGWLPPKASKALTIGIAR